MKTIYTHLLEKETREAYVVARDTRKDVDVDFKSKKQPAKAAAGKAQPQMKSARADTRALFEYLDAQKLDRPASKLAYKKDGIDKNLVTVLRPYAFETEMFKVLRGKILHPMAGEPPRSILITSAVPGEGKSFVASNLAVTIAQLIKEHVLLTDCDLRRPCLHKRFGFADVPGLSEYLSNRSDLPSLLLPTMLKKLSLLPGGRPPHNPSEILSSPKMEALLRELKTRYDDRYLLIDAPPPALAPEALAIANHVDGIIIVVKHKSTPGDLVAELAHSLDKSKIIGMVFNQFDLRSSKYYGYARYKQYKKYNRARA